MKRKIIYSLLAIMSIFSIILTNTRNVSAASYCSAGDITTASSGNYDSYTNAQKTCVCDNSNTSTYSSCRTMKSNISKAQAEKNGNSSVKIYKYILKGDGGSGNSDYSKSMNKLIDTIKSLVSMGTGIIIFILGFGFVWNLVNLGAASNNPQQRQVAIQRLGDVFATALFIGLIPVIANIILNFMQGLS